MRGSHMDNDSIDGYDIPVDPMDLLQCDSCQ
ncbi:ribonucleotide-diphosphate reductase subunit beta [Homoserinibacter sp. YIM 151385]|nr:ribonucleotide-diphosphate reductase subunit beta [Homoserinibacter sp. YIM 151385]WBU36957.1 ribonucleotide-diphosphate reductase subunit beta [Homoserinibacter sp. YIM 151385]